MASNDNDSDSEDDVRHMNDTTMPPPRQKMNDTTMPPPKSVVKATRTGTKSTMAFSKAPPNPRQKAGLRKGFGLQDWVQLTKSAKDLAQRKGAPLRQITLAEVQEHKEIYDGWCALKGKVYNIGPYLAYHPGGESIMKKVLGKDATALFDKYHPWVNIDGLVGTLQLGYLDTKSSSSNDKDDEQSMMPPTARQPTG